MLPLPVELYLQFRVWEPTSGTFRFLPAGIQVDLIASVTGLDDTMLSEATDASGVVHFHAADSSALSHPDAEIYFVVNTNEKILSGTANGTTYFYTLPDKWSTEGGWRADDGTLIDRLPFNPVGTASAPLVYTLGFSFHFQVNYMANVVVGSSKPVPTKFPVLPKTEFVLMADSKPIAAGTIGDQGMIAGTVFDVSADAVLKLGITFKTSSGSAAFPGIDGVTFDSFSGGRGYNAGAPEGLTAIAGRTAIGSSSSPNEILISNEAAASVLYCMKNIAELNQFMSLINDSSGAVPWFNFVGLEIVTGIPKPVEDATSVSYPIGHIFYMEQDNFSRDTHIHEAAHQIMWRYGDFLSFGILATYIGPHANMHHSAREYAHPTHALFEGWAEFIALIFAHNSPGYYDVSPYVSKAPYANAGVKPELIPGQAWPFPPVKIGWPHNWGEHVEGMFAAGLFELFCHYVIEGSGLPRSAPTVPDAGGKDLSALLPWLFASSPEATLARTRFTNVFLKPLQALKTFITPTSTDFIEAMRAHNPSDWPMIRSYLQGFALAFPSIDSWGSPLKTYQVSVSPGDDLDVRGKHFAPTGFMEIRVAAPPSPGAPVSTAGVFTTASLTVHDLSNATIVIPAEPTPNTSDRRYNLQIWTVDGMDEVKNAVHYV